MASSKLTVPILINWNDIKSYMEQHDIVEVVRCKDCIYWNERETNKKGFVVCKATHMDCVEDDYCSFGEKVTK